MSPIKERVKELLVNDRSWPGHVEPFLLSFVWFFHLGKPRLVDDDKTLSAGRSHCVDIERLFSDGVERHSPFASAWLNWNGLFFYFWRRSWSLPGIPFILNLLMTSKRLSPSNPAILSKLLCRFWTLNQILRVQKAENQPSFCYSYNWSFTKGASISPCSTRWFPPCPCPDPLPKLFGRKLLILKAVPASFFIIF